MDPKEKVEQKIIERIGKNLVTWDVMNNNDGQAFVTMTFSLERPGTVLGKNKQGSHVTAYGLIKLLVRLKVNAAAAKSANNGFRGVNDFVEQIMLIEIENDFLLESYFSNAQKTSYVDNIRDALNRRKESANDQRAAVNSAIEVVSKYKKILDPKFPEDLKGNIENLKTKNTIINDLFDAISEINANYLRQVKQDIEQEYFMDLITDSAAAMLEYFNNLPHAVLRNPVTKDKQAIKYHRGEGRRVRDALRALIENSFVSLPRDTENIDSDDDDENVKNEEVVINTAISKRAMPARFASMVTKKKTQELAKKELIHDKLGKEKKVKLTGKSLIVESIYNLLYYPPNMNNENQHDNDLNVFEFVVVRHLSTIIATFGDKFKIDGDDKNTLNIYDIIEDFCKLLLRDWKDVIGNNQKYTSREFAKRVESKLRELKNYMDASLLVLQDAPGRDNDSLQTLSTPTISLTGGSLGSMEDNLLNVQAESTALAQKEGRIGPRSILEWQLQDVDAEGNCFYDAAIHQMQLMQHDFLFAVHSTTTPRDALRLRIQGPQFTDRQWADVEEIHALARELNLTVAIVDTRYPELGFRCFYPSSTSPTGALETNVTGLLPTNIPVIRLAFTGNHYLSVRSHPNLVNGALRQSFHAEPSQISSNTTTPVKPLTPYFNTSVAPTPFSMPKNALDNIKQYIETNLDKIGIDALITWLKEFGSPNKFKM